jgi:hypothetical protein
MPIRRRKLTRNFTPLSNLIFQDKRLGSDELALMFYLLTRPPDWKIIPNDLAKHMKWGREKTYEVLKRLIGFGYITRTQERDSWTQSFGEVVYTVYCNPDDNPALRVKTEKPLSEGPLPEAPLPVNTDHLIRTDRDQKYKTRIIAAAAASAIQGNPANNVVRRDALRDQLADLLYPHDRSTGYEMLSEGAVLEDLLRKLAAGTLIDDDLVSIRNAYLVRGRRPPK